MKKTRKELYTDVKTFFNEEVLNPGNDKILNTGKKHSAKNKSSKVDLNLPEEDVKHLANCTLLCKENFSPKLQNVQLIKSQNPQLELITISDKLNRLGFCK